MTRLSSGARSHGNYIKQDPHKFAAIFLMIDDALGAALFDEAISNFFKLIQKQVSGSVVPTLIKAFQMVFLRLN
jgi:hypothetical protein